MNSGWLSLATTLGAVALGGLLSFGVQRFTQRSADRAERQRQAVAWAEARRAERIALYDRVLTATQAAERVAVDRHHEGVRGPDWAERAAAAMDRVWVEQKLIDIAGSPEVRGPMFEFARSLRRVIWDGPAGKKVWDFVAPARDAFLAAARDEMRRMEPSFDE